jgi:hypothetical protein
VYALAAQASDPNRRNARRIWFVVDRRIVVDEAFERAERIANALENPTSPAIRAVAERLLDMAEGFTKWSRKSWRRYQRAMSWMPSRRTCISRSRCRCCLRNTRTRSSCGTCWNSPTSVCYGGGSNVRVV